MKVEKLFECHQVDKYRRLSMVTSSFQEYATSWWRQRQNDVTKLEILNWSELKARMRRKFVPPSYLKKKEVKKEKIKTIERQENV